MRTRVMVLELFAVAFAVAMVLEADADGPATVPQATVPQATALQATRPPLPLTEERMVLAVATLRPTETARTSVVAYPANISKAAGLALYYGNRAAAYNLGAQVVRQCLGGPSQRRAFADRTTLPRRSALLRAIVQDYVEHGGRRSTGSATPTTMPDRRDVYRALEIDLPAFLRSPLDEPAENLRPVLADMADYCDSRQAQMDMRLRLAQAKDHGFEGLVYHSDAWPDNVVVVAAQLQTEPTVGAMNLLVLLDSARRNSLAAAVRSFHTGALRYQITYAVESVQAPLSFPEIPFVLHASALPAADKPTCILAVCGREQGTAAGGDGGVQERMEQAVIDKLKATFPDAALVTNHGRGVYTKAEFHALVDAAIKESDARARDGRKPVALVCVVGHGIPGGLMAGAKPEDAHLQGARDGAFGIDPAKPEESIDKTEIQQRITDLADHCRTVILHFGTCDAGFILG